MALSSRMGTGPTALARGQWLFLATLVLLTALAWGITIRQARSMDAAMTAPGGSVALEPAPATDKDGMTMDAPASGMPVPAANADMAGMANTGSSWSGFVAFVVAWTVMMAAMMFPAAAPMLLLFQRLSTQRGGGQGLTPTWLFAAGYLAVWSGVGVVAWLLTRLGSDAANRLAEADRLSLAPIALGASLALAGLYQFTPLKEVCLRHCQSPVGFVMTHWRSGNLGALRMGIVHGAFCLGCCWALFAVLIATGVMNLAWMLLLTLIVFAEKVLPLDQRAPRIIGTAFLLLGLLVATRAAQFPWLV
ncbi:MAG: DUF2182 domain-containing protein [Thermomicrobiales bacterium]